MEFPRSAGILLHISSLPGPHGIGDLGAEALRFVDFLVEAGQSYWQILPLGPSDDGNPYVAESSWAGSPFLVSLDELVQHGDLTQGEVESARVPQAATVDFNRVAVDRRRLLTLAAGRFLGRQHGRQEYEGFCRSEAGWLDDWSTFAAIKRSRHGQPWWEWPRGLSLRESAAIDEFRREHHHEISVEKYVQFRFAEQWRRLHEYARRQGVGLIGDVPIYCARDSADVWAAREYFLLDEEGCPTVVSGVPPDYFAKDGQLWGTPIYDWQKLRRERFAWWIGRLRGVLGHTDVVRIDHFRAFESYWEVQATAKTARSGRWVKGPGDEFFSAVREALGEAPFIAEDLGIITRAVRDLRDRWELPGMRVLHFAFGEGAASPHLPFRYPRNCVAYTGTHDNDTTVGWYAGTSERERDLFRRITSSDGQFCHYHLTRLLYGSIAALVVTPMQDCLGLGHEARMNQPGVAKGNWRWKLVPDQVTRGTATMMRDLADLFGRLPGQKEAGDDDPAE